MKKTMYKVTQKKKEMTCRNCIYLEVSTGYTQIVVNDALNWKKRVEQLSFFCNKKQAYIHQKTRYKGCPHKQTGVLTDYCK